MDNKTKITNAPFNGQAVAELRKHLILFIASERRTNCQKYHWVSNCVPFVKA